MRSRSFVLGRAGDESDQYFDLVEFIADINKAAARGELSCSEATRKTEAALDEANRLRGFARGKEGYSRGDAREGAERDARAAISYACAP